MPSLFHQNMRNYGGGSAPRENAYGLAFQNVHHNQAAAGTGPIVVAGFTEIVNAGAAVTSLGTLSPVLGTNLAVVAACGMTALARGPEFIGISVGGGLNIGSVGRIFLQASGQSVGLIHDIAPTNPPALAWCRAVPDNATPDYRGVVYVVVNAPGASFAVGFLHNLYTFEAQRVLVMGKIAEMVGLMRTNPALPGGSPIYLGGDFNVQPLNRRDRSAGTAYAYAAALGNGGTTQAGNLYDYWYTNIPPGGPAPGPFRVPVPMVDASTLNVPAGLSDHAAVLLQIV